MKSRVMMSQTAPYIPYTVKTYSTEQLGSGLFPLCEPQHPTFLQKTMTCIMFTVKLSERKITHTITSMTNNDSKLNRKSRMWSIIVRYCLKMTQNKSPEPRRVPSTSRQQLNWIQTLGGCMCSVCVVCGMCVVCACTQGWVACDGGLLCSERVKKSLSIHSLTHSVFTVDSVTQPIPY